MAVLLTVEMFALVGAVIMWGWFVKQILVQFPKFKNLHHQLRKAIYIVNMGLVSFPLAYWYATSVQGISKHWVIDGILLIIFSSFIYQHIGIKDIGDIIRDAVLSRLKKVVGDGS